MHTNRTKKLAKSILIKNIPSHSDKNIKKVSN